MLWRQTTSASNIRQYQAQKDIVWPPKRKHTQMHLQINYFKKWNTKNEKNFAIFTEVALLITKFSEETSEMWFFTVIFSFTNWMLNYIKSEQSYSHRTRTDKVILRGKYGLLNFRKCYLHDCSLKCGTSKMEKEYKSDRKNPQINKMT